MATLVSDPVRWIADQWENHAGYPSAVLSGIVPDQRHLDGGGYHCSVEDLRRYGNAGDYSNTRPDDKDRNVRYGAAIDMSMSPADMKRCHGRVRQVWTDKTDPRRRYINAINTWDGSGDAVRLDMYANTAKTATSDHKWHNHQETRRRYLLDWTAARAVVSVLKGESKAAWQTGDDVDKSEIVDAVLTALRTPIPVPGRNAERLAAKGWSTNIAPWTILGGYGYESFVDGRVLAELAESKVRQEAILAKVSGDDTDAVLAVVRQQGDEIRAAIDARAAEDAQRDAALAQLYRDGQSGKLTAEEVLAQLKNLLPDPPDTTETDTPAGAATS